MAELEIIERTKSEVEVSRLKAKRGMRAQVIMFSLMIFLTLLSFSIVTATTLEIVSFSKFFAIPVILLFAAIQAVLQLYYFMHMKDDARGVPEMFMFTGALFAFVFVLTFVTITWW